MLTASSFLSNMISKTAVMNLTSDVAGVATKFFPSYNFKIYIRKNNKKRLPNN
jgi:hypothetical protein